MITLGKIASYYNDSNERAEHDVQRGVKCAIPGNIPGQAGWDFEQPVLVKGIPAHAGLGLDEL